MCLHTVHHVQMSDTPLSTWYHAVGAYGPRTHTQDATDMRDLPIELKIKIFLDMDDNTARANFCFAHQEFRPLCDMHSDTMFATAVESMKARHSSSTTVNFLKRIQNRDKRKRCAEIFLASRKILMRHGVINLMEYVISDNLFSEQELAPYIRQALFHNKHHTFLFTELAEYSIDILQVEELHDIYLDAIHSSTNLKAAYALLEASFLSDSVQPYETREFIRRCLRLSSGTRWEDLFNHLARKYSVFE